MVKIYKCPACGSWHSGVADSYEDGGGDYGDDFTPIFYCEECGHSFYGDEGFWGWEDDTDYKEYNDIEAESWGRGQGNVE